MALVYPRDLPTLPVTACRFEPERVDYVSPSTSGRIGAVSAGVPLWHLTLEAKPSTEALSETWRAWVTAQEGSSRQFYGRDVIRDFPMSYQRGFGGLTRADGGAVFDGNATAWAVDGSGRVVTLAGLPVGFALRPGDYIGWRWGTNRRSIARCLEAIQTDYSGVLSMTIAPAIPVVVPSTAVAYLTRPSVLMRLLPDTMIEAVGNARTSAIKISAIQDLLP